MRTKLKSNEKLLLIIKKHPVVFLKPALIAVAVIYIHIMMSNDVSGGAMAKTYVLFAKYFKYVYMLLACYIAYVYLDRQKNIWAVTNMRFIDEWGIITYKSKESHLDKINNVDIVQDPIGRLLGYGNILVQTAATQGETVIKLVEKPLVLRETILSSAETYRTKGMRRIDAFAEAPDADTRECPYCCEMIKKKAVLCRFCGKEVEPVIDNEPMQEREEGAGQQVQDMPKAAEEDVTATIVVDDNVARKLLDDDSDVEGVTENDTEDEEQARSHGRKINLFSIIKPKRKVQ